MPFAFCGERADAARMHLTGWIIGGWLALAVAFGLVWFWRGRDVNAAYVDVLWAYGVGFLAVVFALGAVDGAWERRALVAVCAAFWSLRLGTHILRRVAAEGTEDARYRYLREHWGERAGAKFFWFFQGQALADLLLAAPLLLIMLNPRPALTVWDAAGAALIVLAVLGERAADGQLARWKRDPANRGKTCRKGWWAYSRHPNYFFEWLHWLGYPVMGIGLSGTPLAPWWPLTLLPAAVMLALLLRGTGIPHTERQALRSRGENYARYQREVSAFVPWFRS